MSSVARAKPCFIVPSNPLMARRMALSTAVSLALGAMPVYAEDWEGNIEVFAMPTNERTLMGAQLLQPIWQDQTSMAYLDFRGIVDLGDTNEFNLGAGYRRMAFDRRWIFGGYASFDTRETRTDNRFNQVTLGLEALSREWDFRVNGYIPTTDEKTLGPASFGGRFQGNRLFAGRRTEEALHGMDIEVGRLLEFIPFGETRLYLAGYHFDGDVVSKSTGFGKKARIEYRPRKDITLELGIQDDNLFGTESFLKISYSFGMPAENGIRTMDERMVEFAERDVDIRTTGPLPERLTTATGPGKDLLISDNVVHVDNENDDPEGGDGTIENPYTSVANCNAGRCVNNQGAIIYVHEGEMDYTDEGFMLENMQRLLGQGVSLYGIGGDAYPVLRDNTTDNGSYGVELSRNNEVAGLRFEGHEYAISNYNAKYGSGININSFNIHDNQIYGASSAGIEIFTGSFEGNVSSTGRIANNTIVGSYGEFGGGQGTGIFLGNTALGNGASSTQSVTVTQNDIAGHESGLYAENTAINGGSATQNLDIGSNYFAGNKYTGAHFTNRDSSGTGETAIQDITLTGNTFVANGIGNGQDDGPLINGPGMGSKYGGGAVFGNYAEGESAVAQQTISASDNVFALNSNGLMAYNRGDEGGSAQQDVTLTNNEFYENKYAGAGFINLDGASDPIARTATQNVTLIDNEFRYNGLYGGGGPVGSGAASFMNSAKYGSTATQTADLSGNSMLYNSMGLSALNLGIDGGAATQEFTLTDNQIGNSEFGGAGFLNIDGGSAPQAITAIQRVTSNGGNSISNNNGPGVYAENNAFDGGEARQFVDLSGDSINSNDGPAVLVGNRSEDADSLAQQELRLNGASLTDNAYGGVFSNEADGGTANQYGDLYGADFGGSGGYAIDGDAVQQFILPDGDEFNNL
ncbi:hypothetical protein J2T55_002567 [Methylohalomonas lacus]|uniref:Inverse autotransporter beta-domain domain-containing protein n=1 Tax=Methylohalomonas lacus TaxID=398773 RepID=A0AAE3HPI1_9GAMM|nr:inverse autotransporter beta domain-containing protein [Methylohalomonas lacus]MCS3904528.1 hypothetical protein [Methylohalomonas lacus]